MSYDYHFWEQKWALIFEIKNDKILIVPKGGSHLSENPARAASKLQIVSKKFPFLIKL